jgi:RimJ/RimL family protein N-acetyltransferase
MAVNALGQPIGEPVPDWTARLRPTTRALSGRYCRLERLDPDRHGEELFRADRLDATGESWTYLPYGPFGDLASYRAWLEQVAAAEDPYFLAVIDTDDRAPAQAAGRAVGLMSLLRVHPEAGSIEVGHIHFSPLLQRRRGATEAQFLLMRHVFDDLGYRRYEWKCDALNAPSRAAAERLGFRYEGTFRQAQVVKARNRDTAWFSILDREWPRVADAARAWLAPDNFDDRGGQRASLETLRDQAFPS